MSHTIPKCDGCNTKGSRDLVQGVHNGQAGCGKLLLATDAPPAVLTNLRCVQVRYDIPVELSSAT